MDRFSVVITGAAPHHSAQATDIDALLGAFVAQLRAAGHAGVMCTLTTNACEETIAPAVALAQPPAQLSELAVMVAYAPAPRASRAPREG